MNEKRLELAKLVGLFDGQGVVFYDTGSKISSEILFGDKGGNDFRWWAVANPWESKSFLVPIGMKENEAIEFIINQLQRNK